MANKADLFYSNPPPPLIATARRNVRENRRYALKHYGHHVARHEALLDAFHAFIAAHVWTFQITRAVPTALQQLTFSAVHKNVIALFGMLENILMGLHGPARPLFRQVMEAQLLAKFVAIRKDDALAARWLAAEPLSVPRVVFSALSGPQAVALKALWSATHGYVHHTTGSQQTHLSVNENDDLVAHDLTVMGMLLHTQHHLITRIAFSRADRYYAEMYDDDHRLPQLRRTMQEHLSTDLKEHGKDVRSYIRTFRATWRAGDGSPLT